jgi:hypothetical protein
MDLVGRRIFGGKQKGSLEPALAMHGFGRGIKDIELTNGGSGGISNIWNEL